ncbi:MAG: hypothetical protein IKV83_02825 [Muribaculaceae bacterium]|nr:hypothetical protein [Muribaculaceae bacterium]
MKILYIHGLSSSGSSSTASRLRELLPQDTIISPDLPINPQEALNMLLLLCKEEQIDLAIGTSMGGMFAQKLRGYRKILVNPAFHVSQSLRNKIGVNPYFSSRKDGATEFEITPELCDLYEKLEEEPFKGLTQDELNITHGLFATNDTVVNCGEEYLQFYDNYYTFEGEHRLSLDNLKNDVIPLIEKIRVQI